MRGEGERGVEGMVRETRPKLKGNGDSAKKTAAGVEVGSVCQG